jgi:hypothetical protein
LVEELLSQRVGIYRTKLEEISDDLSDPAQNQEARELAERLRAALESGAMIWVEPMVGSRFRCGHCSRGVGFTRFGVGPSVPLTRSRFEHRTRGRQEQR